MKKIILSLLAVLATLSIDAATVYNIIEVYKNGSLVRTFFNSTTDFYRAEIKKGESYENQLLIYKYTKDDNQGSLVATYTNTTDDKYRADLKQCGTTGTSTTKDGQIVNWVQLWEDGPRFAAVNVGATITDYTGVNTYDYTTIGNYYSWGASEAQTATNYEEASDSEGDIQGTDEDTAKKVWGDNWLMPSYDKIDKLMDSNYTTWEWCDGATTQFEEGCTLAGYKITGAQSGFIYNCIFLPAAGGYDMGVSQYPTGSMAFYWTSTNALYGRNKYWPHYIYFDDEGYSWDQMYITAGLTIRAILNE